MNLQTHQPRSFEQAAADIAADNTLLPRVFGPMIEAGAQAYVRARDLPKILALLPHELEDFSFSGCRHIIAKCAAGAMAQRRLRLRGSWAYNRNKHIALLSAMRAELQWIGGAD